jgi:hypothetical protein
VAPAPMATGAEIDAIARRMVAEGDVRSDRAAALVSEARG